MKQFIQTISEFDPYVQKPPFMHMSLPDIFTYPPPKSKDLNDIYRRRNYYMTTTIENSIADMPLTDEAVSELYDKGIADELKDKIMQAEHDALIEAVTAAEDPNEEPLKEMNSELVKDILGGVVEPEKYYNEDTFSSEDAAKIIAELDKTQVSDDSIKKIASTYKNVGTVNSLEELQLVKVLTVFRDNKNKENDDTNYYDMLPNSLKTFVAQTINIANAAGEKMTLQEAAKFAIESIYDDAIRDDILNEYQAELSKTTNEMNDELTDIYAQHAKEIEDKFRSTLSESNPDLLAKYDACVMDAYSFKRQVEAAKKLTPKKIKKAVERFSNECFYLDTKIVRLEEKYNFKIATRIGGNNKIDVGERIVKILTGKIAKYTTSQARRFVLTIINTIVSLNPEDLFDVVYGYNLIEVLLRYEFKDFNPETDQIIVDNISEVMKVLDEKMNN